MSGLWVAGEVRKKLLLGCYFDKYFWLKSVVGEDIFTFVFRGFFNKFFEDEYRFFILSSIYMGFSWDGDTSTKPSDEYSL